MIAAPTTRRAASSLLAWLATATAALACSSSTPAGGASNPADGGGGGDGGAIGGRSATTLTCESFPASELLKAIQTLAPKTTAGATKTERLADNFGSPLLCNYTFAANLAPGLDPSTPIGQTVHFRVEIRDEIVDGVPTLQDVRDGFAKERDRVKGHVSGDATSATQYGFLAVADLGESAYFDDYVTRSDVMTLADRSDLFVLRTTLPFSANIKMDYSTQPDTSIPAPAAATDPFQNDTRHDIVKAFAKVVLSKR